MPHTRSEDGLNKFQRYRRSQHAKGLKLLRVWTLDPAAPEFRREMRWQAALLRDAPEEAEALRFIETVEYWPEQ